jgi:release factor glutamine methyltransferase
MATEVAAGALLAASGLPTAEARALLAHVLGAPREALVARPQQAVAASAAHRFAALAARRRAGEPLAYLLGEREFYGRPFAVDANVLVPRPETETLVALALARLQAMAAPRVLDLGTGCGCIAITLALQCPHATVVATDASPEALAVARANAQRLGACVSFARGDWYGAIDGRFDLIVSNPPYVAEGDPHLADLRHEPPLALAAGADGLACLREIVAGAPASLRPGACLLVEHGYGQAAAVRELFRAAGFAAIATERDLAGIERVTFGTIP